MHEVAQRLSERRSLIDQEDNKRLCLQGVHTGIYGTSHSTNISKISCPFHHRVYYQLTIARFPVGLITSTDRVTLLVNRKVKVRFPVKPENFEPEVLFQSFRLFILLQRSRSLSYLYPQFKMTYFIRHSPFPI